MNALTIRDFRNNMAAAFDRSKAGERVLVRRRGALYAVVPVEENPSEITPELAKKIERARKDFREGRTYSCRTREELKAFLDSL